MRFVAIAIALGLGVVSGPALAEDGAYLELQGGASFLPDADFLGISNALEYDTGFNAGLAIGFRAFEMLRLEAHGSYRQADIDKLLGMSVPDTVAGAIAVLGNAYFDIPVPLPIKPYVGAGLGVAIFAAGGGDSVDLDDTDTRFAWNAMGGFFVPIHEHFELDARYRYLRSEDPEVAGFDVSFEAHEVVGALRVVF